MFDPVRRPYSNGISWGVRGFRIGRNQYGNWWISVGLPFGFRYSKTLGKLRSDSEVINQTPQINETDDHIKWKNLK